MSGFAEDGQIYVRTLTGKNISISYSAERTINSIKQEIAEQEGIPVDQQRLVYQGKQLEDMKTLASCNINKDATIHLVLRLRGGAGSNF